MTVMRYLSKMSNLFAENRLLKFVIVALAAMQVFTLYYVNSMVASQKVVIIPPGLDEKAIIEQNSVSEAYVKAFTRYVVGLALNYSHVNVRSQFDELLLLYEPEAMAITKDEFYSIADEVENSKVTSIFHIQKITLDPNTKEITIKGIKRQYVEEEKIVDKSATYLIDYIVRRGEFLIKEIKEKL